MQENDREIEKRITSRIKSVLGYRGMSLSAYAQNLGWPLSRLSKILSGEQKLTVADGSDMIRALGAGYTLEQFMSDEFDIENLDVQGYDYSFGECIRILSHSAEEEIVKECMLRHLPRAVKKILEPDSHLYVVEGVHGQAFSISGKNNVEPLKGNKVFRSEVTVRLSQTTLQTKDFPRLGVVFNTDFSEVRLMIYCPYSAIRAQGSHRRTYFQNFFPAELVTTFREKRRTRVGEIIGKGYSLEEGLFDEECFITDLRTLFEALENVLEKAVQTETQKVEHACKMEVIAQVKKHSAYCGYCKGESFCADDGMPYFDFLFLVPHKKGCDTYVVENIVPLCPTCYAKIHHAPLDVREEMLVALYYERRDSLRKAGLDLPLSSLLKMY